jgi:DNA-binding transcriptional regulator YiaG
MTTITLEEEVRLRRALVSPAARRALREELGLSRRAIAEQIGVTEAAVRLWELGARRPTGEHLRRYVEVLELLRREPAR